MKLQQTDTIAIKFREGDKSAFEAIFREFYPLVLNFANSLVNDRQVAEEICLDTFLKLHKLRGNFNKDSKSSIKAFLMITTRNACFDWLSLQKRRSQETSAYIQYSASGEEVNIIEEMEAELVSHILLKVEALPPQRKIIFIMRGIKGLKHQEIADKLNISVNTVKNQYVQAVKDLRMRVLNSDVFAFYCLPFFCLLIQ